MAGHVKNIMSYLVESQTQIYGINFMAENIQYARLRSIFYAKMLRVHYASILYITMISKLGKRMVFGVQMVGA